MAETAQAMLDSDLVATEATDAVGVTELGPARTGVWRAERGSAERKNSGHTTARASRVQSGEDEDEDDARGRRARSACYGGACCCCKTPQKRGRRGGGESTQRRGASGTNTLDARAQASRGDGDVAASLPSVVLHARVATGPQRVRS